MPPSRLGRRRSWMVITTTPTTGKLLASGQCCTTIDNAKTYPDDDLDALNILAILTHCTFSARLNQHSANSLLLKETH